MSSTPTTATSKTTESSAAAGTAIIPAGPSGTGGCLSESRHSAPGIGEPVVENAGGGNQSGPSEVLWVLKKSIVYLNLCIQFYSFCIN